MSLLVEYHKQEAATKAKQDLMLFEAHLLCIHVWLFFTSQIYLDCFRFV